MKPNLPRGFQTRAEKLSLTIRERLGLRPTHTCPARRVAELYGYSVTSVGALIGLIQSGFEDSFISSDRVLDDLLRINGLEFSGMMALFRSQKMIFYNDQESSERQESVIMHEMAHALCEHPGDDLQLNSVMGMRQHDSSHEEQARWLGGVLQIPDVGLFWYAKNGYSLEAIARAYSSSIEMARYRWNACGISARLNRIGLTPAS
jgi:hypothetical protein